MTEDVWITPNQVIDKLTIDLPDKWSVVVKTWRDAKYVCLKNQHGCSIFRLRIFNGDEHMKAKKGMCLEHSLLGFLNG